MNPSICAICNKSIEPADLRRGETLTNAVFTFIKKAHPNFEHDSLICNEDVNKLKREYLEKMILHDSQQLSHLEKDVLKAIQNDELISENISNTAKESLTLGQKVADQIAKFGGSWTFIISFFSFILIWMLINIWILATQPFDPFPFILLNLILSCLAAIQAPIIMMSQNRTEEKDRNRSEHDYKVNLKAELEIRLLHDKIDHMIVHQNKRLLEIQELQLDYLEQLTNNGKKKE
jgi:uncharacterized membrane protein